MLLSANKKHMLKTILYEFPKPQTVGRWRM